MATENNCNPTQYTKDGGTSRFASEQPLTFRLGEFFSGPGGMAYGALQSRVESDGAIFQMSHAWATDYDPATCRTYRRNICSADTETVYCEDVRVLDIAKLSPIDAFAFGFPCNDFSLVGEKKGIEGAFGPLYAYGVRALNHFKPKFFVAENVSGLSSANEGATFRRILSDMRCAGNGYRLTAHLYRAEEYGVPQTRHRIIIVGVEDSLQMSFRIPAPTHAGRFATAREALEIPPIPLEAANQERTAQSKLVVERLSHIKPGENAWNASLPERLRLNVKGAKMSQIYRRLDPERPSYTVTGSGGGGTHCYHWSEPRALTNRERARIQSFPDSFVFEGSKESVRKQIGMAVPPLLSKVIFTAVLQTFAGVDYPSVQSNFRLDKETSLTPF